MRDEVAGEEKVQANWRSGMFVADREIGGNSN